MKKITCSGSFKTNPGTDKGRYDFTDVIGLMPDCEEEYLISHAIRMFPIWKKENKELKKVAFSGLIKLYVDKVEDVGGQPLCAGKDIKKMTWEELQSLACYLKLREIPLYRQGSLRAAQEKAYEVYQRDILEKKVFRTAQDIRVFKEQLRRNLENLMMKPSEIENKVEEAVKEGFSMLVNPNDPQNSYSFSRVASVIIKGYDIEQDEKPKKEKKVSV